MTFPSCFEDRAAWQCKTSALRLFEKLVSTSDMSCALFEGHQVLTVNASWEKMCGYTKKDIVGNTMKLLQGAETGKGNALASFHGSLMAGKDAENIPLLNYRKDHSMFQNNASVYVLPNNMFVGLFEEAVFPGNPVTNTTGGTPQKVCTSRPVSVAETSAQPHTNDARIKNTKRKRAINLDTFASSSMVHVNNPENKNTHQTKEDSTTTENKSDENQPDKRSKKIRRPTLLRRTTAVSLNH